MEVRKFIVGPFLTNCYVANCEQTREAVIIDPGFVTTSETENTLDYVREHSLKVKYVLNTHGHPDHTCGNGFVKAIFHVPILIHEDDADFLGETGKKVMRAFGFPENSPPADDLLRDTETISFGELALRVMHTPGHSQGSITFVERSRAFTGDTLFAGSIGRTDFPESSDEDMNDSLRKLTMLPDETLVYPGHGPDTNIQKEKEENPFLDSSRL